MSTRELPLCEYSGFLDLSGGGGGFAEEIVVDAEQTVPLDDVPVEHGVEPLSVGLHAVRQINIHPGDSVAVFGSGPIGISVIQSVCAAGADPIIVSEPQESRREVAAQSGADELLNPMETDAVEQTRSLTDGGVDVALRSPALSHRLMTLSLVRSQLERRWSSASGRRLSQQNSTRSLLVSEL